MDSVNLMPAEPFHYLQESLNEYKEDRPAVKAFFLS